MPGLPAMPERAPLYDRILPFPTGFAQNVGLFCLRETLWLATATEPGQHRHTYVGAGEFELGRHHAEYILIEHLASAGMRHIFEDVGLMTTLQVSEDRTSYPEPVVRHESAFVFPSDEQLVANINARLGSFSGGTRLSLALLPHGKYHGVEWVPPLGDGIFKISGEVPADLQKRQYLSYYQHDICLHVPAWLAMPPFVTTRAYAKSREATIAYRNAVNSDDTDIRAYDRRVAPATETIDQLTGNLDIINTVQLRQLLTGGEEDITPVLAEALGGDPAEYKHAILEHIANPRWENILVARTG